MSSAAETTSVKVCECGHGIDEHRVLRAGAEEPPMPGAIGRWTLGIYIQPCFRWDRFDGKFERCACVHFRAALFAGIGAEKGREGE